MHGSGSAAAAVMMGVALAACQAERPALRFLVPDAGPAGEVSFGTRPAYERATQVILAENTTDSPMTLEALWWDGDAEGCLAFPCGTRPVLWTSDSLPQDIPAHGSTPVTIVFAAAIAADLEPPTVFKPPRSWAARLRAQSRTKSGALAQAETLVTATMDPALCAVPQALTFGGVLVGERATVSMSVRNPLEEPSVMEVREALVPEWGTGMAWAPSTPRGPFLVDAGATQEFSWTFAPTETGSVAARAVLQPGTPCMTTSVWLIGQGVNQLLEWSPETVDLGTVDAGSPRGRWVDLMNLGLQPLHVTGLSLDEGGQASRSFRMDAGASSLELAGATFSVRGQLQPGRAALLIEATATEPGLHAALLKATTDAPRQETIAIPLQVVVNP